MPYQPVMSVGTAMIAAQLVTFFMIWFVRKSRRLRFVSTIVLTRSRSASVDSVDPQDVVVHVLVVGVEGLGDELCS